MGVPRPEIVPLWLFGLSGPVAVLAWATAAGSAGAATVAFAVGAVFALVLLRVERLLRDVERQALELVRLSGTDALTGLPNRRAWEEDYAAIHRRCTTATEPVAVLMLDLDHFKAYNDTHGHLAGDRLLQSAVRRWQAVLRPGDLLARWGGEEFAACLPGCGADVAGSVAARLLSVVPEGQTVSVGLAVSAPDEDGPSLVERADAALYAAKRAGRARTVFAQPRDPVAGRCAPPAVLPARSAS